MPNAGIVTAGVMTYAESGLPKKQQQCYRVRHRRGADSTAASNQACAILGDGGPLHPQP
jgi:hypothetical protein